MQNCFKRHPVIADLRYGKEDSFSPSPQIFLPQRAKLVNTLSVSPLRYSRSLPCA